MSLKWFIHWNASCFIENGHSDEEVGEEQIKQEQGGEEMNP